jgi:hypothetical protein
MANKPRHTLADYVAIAISPALIMALVSSLVFFVLAVVYVGDFIERLRWVLFWYVFGSVLVARISMESSASSRAPLYGLVLAILVFVALLIYIDYPAEQRVVGWLINFVLIGIIWWSTYKLTWDCTYIDDKVEQSGAGLLQAAGLEDAKTSEAVSATDEDGKKLTWWQRYQRYREEKKKKHAPGLWVVYYSLAALPIFGLGQALIPVDEPERRRHVFWLMGIYVGSGLGLLLTTSFLGLRRYLRQRNLQMPTPMAGAWLGIGAVLVFCLLVAGALLPRPESETPLFSLAKLTGERDANDYDVLGGKGGKGDDKPSGGDQKDDPNGDATRSGEKGEGSGDKDASGSGDKQGSQGGGKGDKQGSKSDGSPSKNQSGNSGDKSKSGGKGKSGSGGDPSGKKGKTGSQGSKAGRSNSTLIPHIPTEPASWLKWIVFGLLALVVLFVLFRRGLGFLANFTDWAKNLLAVLHAWWARLFGWGKKAEIAAESVAMEAAAPPARPFSAFRNPFRDGSAAKRSPQELVRYSFAALQAWAWEQGLARADDETPLEFAHRLGEERPALDDDARQLAFLFARVVYARGSLPSGTAGAVQQFWGRLEDMSEQPMSA